MTTLVQQFIGPRVPAQYAATNRARFLMPTLCLAVARLLLLVSVFLPYWRMTLHAPQYPKGLHVQAYVNHLEGDVKEIDGLNHYIGMRPLNEAAQFERAVSVFAIIALTLLVEGAAYVHTKWAALLALPTILFPPFFLIDLHFWLSSFGRNLDPKAPLSNAIEPFTPPVLGTGVVGQFETVASAGPGLILASTASLIVIIGLYFHRRAYRPLVQAAGRITHDL
jgi:hypothetical protein